MRDGMSIRNNEADSRYELEVDGHVAFARYRRSGEVLSILHVEAPPALRGSGAAGRLMQGVMDQARIDGVRVDPVCSYAALWIDRHPDYQDLRA